MADRLDRMRRINIPTPNADLEKWLMGPECRALVERVTTEIYTLYQYTLPASRFDPRVPGSGEHNLRRGADMMIAQGGWYGEQDRWFGWVTNHALSYRKKRGEPYPRYIEYGKPTKGIPGQGQLRNAARVVAGELGTEIGVNLPGISRVERGRGSTLRGSGGRFVRNPLNRD